MRWKKPDPENPYDRATLKQILKVLPGGLTTVGKDRNPRLLLETKELPSPADADVVFTIKKATNREDVERSNLFAKVEYVTADDTGELVTRRDFPMGDLQVSTILLCLVKWNITDGGKDVSINRQTLLDYLTPEERVFLYQEVIDFNPIWGNREAVKS